MTASAKKRPKPAPPPTPEEEEAAFIESLVRQGKAVPKGCRLPPGATHRLVVTPSGAKRVKRKRYSTV